MRYIRKRGRNNAYAECAFQDGFASNSFSVSVNLLKTNFVRLVLIIKIIKRIIMRQQAMIARTQISRVMFNEVIRKGG